MKKTLYCYGVEPVDRWIGVFSAKRLNDLVVSFGEGREREKICPTEWVDLGQELARLKLEAEEAFRRIGWEGDIREGPFYFAVPHPATNSMQLGYVLKQDNNGMTFVASPVPMSWLDDDAFIEISYEDA